MPLFTDAILLHGYKFNDTIMYINLIITIVTCYIVTYLLWLIDTFRDAAAFMQAFMIMFPIGDHP